MAREWKQWEYPDMRFINWEKLQLGFWHNPRDAVQMEDLVTMILHAGVGQFRVKGIYLLPGSKDAMILQLAEVGYVKLKGKDKLTVQRLREATDAKIR